MLTDNIVWDMQIGDGRGRGKRGHGRGGREGERLRESRAERAELEEGKAGYLARPPIA
jgi:hypothetical protein